MITAIIFTKNEEKRLSLVFNNLKGFADIIVFDGGSTDGTEQICKEHGVRFVTRPRDLEMFRGVEYQWGMSQVKTPYVLLVNCSHHHPVKLLNTYKRVATEGKYHAVYNDIVIYSYGCIVHRPFFRRRSSGCNFFRVDAINFENSVIHNEAPVDLSEELILRLKPSDDLSIHLFRDYDLKKTEHNHGIYSEVEANQRFTVGKRATYVKIIFSPLHRFLHQYIRCGSILRGKEGLIYSLLGAYLELSIQIRILELQNDIDLVKVTALHAKIRTDMVDSNY